MSKTKKNQHLAAILAGTDSQFTWTLHPLRERAIMLKQARVTAKERQFLLDIFAAFDADFPLTQIAGTTTVRIPLIADTHSKLIADSVPGDRGHPG